MDGRGPREEPAGPPGDEDEAWPTEHSPKEQPGMLFLAVEYEPFPPFSPGVDATFTPGSQQQTLTCLSNMDPNIGHIYEVPKSVIVSSDGSITTSSGVESQVSHHYGTTTSNLVSPNASILSSFSEVLSNQSVPFVVEDCMESHNPPESRHNILHRVVMNEMGFPEEKRFLNLDFPSSQPQAFSAGNRGMGVPGQEDMVEDYQLNHDSCSIGVTPSVLPTSSPGNELLLSPSNMEAQRMVCRSNEQSLDKVELVIENNDGIGLTYTIDPSSVPSMLLLGPKNGAWVLEQGEFGELRVRRSSPIQEECLQDMTEVDAPLLEAIQNHLPLAVLGETHPKNDAHIRMAERRDAFCVTSHEVSDGIIMKEMSQASQKHNDLAQLHCSSPMEDLVLEEPQPSVPNSATVVSMMTQADLSSQPHQAASGTENVSSACMNTKEDHHQLRTPQRSTEQQAYQNHRPALAEKTFRRENNENNLKQGKKNHDCKATNSIWTDDCSACADGDCLAHVIQSISDKPVLSRAWATLPAAFLAVNKFSDLHSGRCVTGVFARKLIPRNTQFGPLEGMLVKKDESPNNNLKPKDSAHHLDFIIENEAGAFFTVDLSDENHSNWMRFVRSAGNSQEQNVALCQVGTSLYFRTTRDIQPRQELLIWYSPGYAMRRGFPLEPEGIHHPWTCFKCNQTFSNSIDIQKHLNEHEAEQNENEDSSQLRPAKCSYSMRRQGLLNFTLKKGKFKLEKGCGKVHHQCSICKRVFIRSYSLKRHILSHAHDRKPCCPKCNARFGDITLRNRHMRSVHNIDTSLKKSDNPIGGGNSCSQKVWICGLCSLVFSNSCLLSLHTLTHKPADGNSDNSYQVARLLLDDGSVQCPDCCVTFSSIELLTEHVASHGKDGICKRKRKVNPLKPFRCEMCYKGFTSDERLQQHMLVHGSEESKPVECKVCSKRFLTNPALACHIRIHTNQSRLFDCPICKETFLQITTLKEHVQIHASNGCFTCPYCNKLFNGYGPIRKHIRAFHNERTQKCSLCEHQFPTLDKLRQHMLRHSDHREFLCANCGKQFKRKDKLKEHMKRMHEREQPPKPHVKARVQKKRKKTSTRPKKTTASESSDYERYLFKCHPCRQGFKRRGMLVNHLAKRHPNIAPEEVPELNMPILKATRDYACVYCEKTYKSSSKRKAHILKYHPGGELPVNRFKATGTAPTQPQSCEWCYKQYATKAKLLQHQRREHTDKNFPQVRRKPSNKGEKVSLVEVGTQNDSTEDNLILAECTMTLLEGLQVYDVSVPLAPKDSVAKNGGAAGDLLTQAMSELDEQPEYHNIHLNTGDTSSDGRLEQMMSTGTKVVYTPYPPR